MFPFPIIDQKAKAASLPYLVIGGHAVNVYAEPRATLDVDVLSTWNRKMCESCFDVLGLKSFMTNSADDSKDGRNSDALREIAPTYDFDLPLAPNYMERPPQGSWEAGYILSLRALELVQHRPEIFEQRNQRMYVVEFVL
jgi:hypothetical protein